MTQDEENKKEVAVFDELKTDIKLLVYPSKQISVESFSGAQSAIETAKNIRELKNRIEKKRKELVDPINARVRSINDYAKSIAEPLNEAEDHIKRQLVAFETEQEKRREQERRRLENEKRLADEALKKKQEAELQTADVANEASSVFGTSSSNDIEKRHAEERAVQKHEFKGKEWDVEQQGLKNARKTWKCRLVDAEKCPKDLLIVTLNERAVLALARAGKTEIPGVELWQETSVAIGQRTYVPKAALNGFKS